MENVVVVVEDKQLWAQRKRWWITVLYLILYKGHQGNKNTNFTVMSARVLSPPPPRSRQDSSWVYGDFTYRITNRKVWQSWAWNWKVSSTLQLFNFPMLPFPIFTNKKFSPSLYFWPRNYREIHLKSEKLCSKVTRLMVVIVFNVYAISISQGIKYFYV